MLRDKIFLQYTFLIDVGLKIMLGLAWAPINVGM